MEIITTGFEGLIIIKPTLFEDSRGYFYESYNFKVFNHHGINQDFVQDNQSKSMQDVIRGLHYQLAPYAQTKLVRVLHGEIYDVAVDLRKSSPTFGKWYGIELSGNNNIQLLIPRGFAHGFSVLSPEAVVMYKTDDYYCKEAERGIVYNDPMLDINWKTGNADAIVSERDRQLPLFKNAEMNFIV
ncbi:MAG TPA: dTDP-4-dehydrorhamnose 3,5-epimerase [Bacteroidales bacterium]|nr:dTDP-4-dehydrorhamnose 3,5-epimerase [Bacteroidales bacterium]